MGAAGDHDSTRCGCHAADPPLAWRLDGADDDPDLPLVLALHGHGMTEDLFARLLRGLGGAPFRVLTPRAPSRAAGGRGASWYDYDGNPARFRAELERCEAQLLDFLRGVEREHGLTPRRRWLLGFSQGGYCGSWLALRHPDVFRGMAVVGARVKTEWLAAPMARAAAAGFAALLCHGRRDGAVPPAAAERSRAALAAAGVTTELRLFDAGHSLGRTQVAAIREWLLSRPD